MEIDENKNQSSQLLSLHLSTECDQNSQEIKTCISDTTVKISKNHSKIYSNEQLFSIIKAIQLIVQKLSFYENLKHKIMEKDIKILDMNFRIQEKLSSLISLKQQKSKQYLFQQLTQEAKDCQLLMNEISLNFVKIIELFTNFDSQSSQNSPSVKIPTFNPKFAKNIQEKYQQYFQAHRQYLYKQIQSKTKTLNYYKQVIFQESPQIQIKSQKQQLQALTIERDYLRITVKQWQKICDQYLEISAHSKSKAVTYQKILKEKLSGFKNQIQQIKKNQRAIQQDIEQYILNQLEQFTDYNKRKVNNILNQIASILHCHKADIIKQIKILQDKNLNVMNVQQNSFQVIVSNNPQFSNCEHLIQQSSQQQANNQIPNSQLVNLNQQILEKQLQIKQILQKLSKLQSSFQLLQRNKKKTQRKILKLQKQIQLKNQSIISYQNENQYLLNKIFGYIAKWNQFWEKKSKLLQQFEKRQTQPNSKQQPQCQCALDSSIIQCTPDTQIIQNDLAGLQAKLHSIKARPFIKKSNKYISNN